MNIKFTYKGILYEVDQVAADENKRIVLSVPEGIVLHADAWEPGDPPVPINLHEIDSGFTVKPKPRAMAYILDGVIATKV